MNNGQCESVGLTAMGSAPFINNPKGVRIQTVENGFTVTLEGGKQEKSTPYRNSKLLVAKDNEEALKISSEFLTD